MISTPTTAKAEAKNESKGWWWREEEGVKFSYNNKSQALAALVEVILALLLLPWPSPAQSRAERPVEAGVALFLIQACLLVSITSLAHAQAGSNERCITFATIIHRPRPLWRLGEGAGIESE